MLKTINIIQEMKSEKYSNNLLYPHNKTTENVCNNLIKSL